MSSYSHPLFFRCRPVPTYRSVPNPQRSSSVATRHPLNSVENAPLGRLFANAPLVVYCFSAARMERMAQRRNRMQFYGTTTVKWRGKFAQNMKTVLRRAETFSDQDCGNRVYTNTLDAFLGSAWREGRLLLDSIGSFLKLCDIYFGGSTRWPPLRHGRLLARQIKALLEP
jgi:hypothetical protein